MKRIPILRGTKVTYLGHELTIIAVQANQVECRSLHGQTVHLSRQWIDEQRRRLEGSAK